MRKLFYTCGAAKNEITPPEYLMDKQRNLMGCSFSRILHRLYTRVIAIGNGEETCLLVSFDLDKAPNPQRGMEELSRKTGVPVNNITYIGIHTHSAPVIGVRPDEHRPFLQDPDTRDAIMKYDNYVMDVMYRTAEEAIENMRPAHIGYGKGKSFININRAETVFINSNGDKDIPCIGCGSNGAGPVDDGVYVVEATDASGKPIAFFVNYAIHCSILFKKFPSSDGVPLSGDLGGIISQFIEAEFENAVAIWSSGAAGDVNAIVRGYPHYINVKTGEIEYNDDIEENTALTIFNHLSTRNFADTLHVIRSIKSFSESGEIHADVQWVSVPKRDGSTWDVRMHLLRIGDIALMGIGGELYTRHNFAIKESAAMRNTIVVTHDASLIKDAGYILDDSTIIAAQNAPNEKVASTLPGVRGASNMIPGVMEPAFRKMTDMMFKNVM